jgi:hypothetical protein
MPIKKSDIVVIDFFLLKLLIENEIRRNSITKKSFSIMLR